MKPIFDNKKLIFNNYLAEDLGFIVVEGPPEILAQEQYELLEVEGRNGSLVRNKGTYPDLEKTFTITTVDYLDTEDIPAMMDAIKKWFFDITDNRLFYAYNDRYNIVKKVIFDEDIKTSFEEFGDFQVTFLCEPFYYLADEEPLVIVTDENGVADESFENIGDFDSYPIIKIYGIGNVNFYLGKNLEGGGYSAVGYSVKNVSSYVEIDSKLLLCYDQNKMSKLGDLSAVSFPVLIRGTHRVILKKDSNISKIEIIPRTIFR